jgi:AraC family transcriptional regulator
MKSMLLVIFVVVMGLGIYLSFNLGVYKSVSLTEGSYQELHLIYKDYVGPYYKIAEKISEVEAWAKTQGLPCPLTFGEFMDDPSVVEHERLRSRGGCVVDSIPANLPSDIKSITVPSRQYILAHFNGSPWLGPYKVYNKVADLAREKNIRITESVIELYDLKDAHHLETTYLFPIPSEKHE